MLAEAVQEAGGVVGVSVLCVPSVEGPTPQLPAWPVPGWGSRDSRGEWEGTALACGVTQERASPHPPGHRAGGRGQEVSKALLECDFLGG